VHPHQHDVGAALVDHCPGPQRRQKGAFERSFHMLKQ
jgi:hypothetical protein